MNEILHFLDSHFWLALIVSSIASWKLSKQLKKKTSEKNISMTMLVLSVVVLILTFYSCSFNIKPVIDECVEERDFEGAHKWLDRMKEEDYLTKDNRALRAYSASPYLLKKYELLEEETAYLMNLEDEESLNRVISIMYNFQFDYSPYIGEFESYNKSREEYRVNKRCDDEIMRYNRKCDVLLYKAINIGNLEFAKALLDLYKENLVIEETNFNLFGKNVYTVTTSRKDIDNAKETLQKAIEEGKFGDVNTKFTKLN